MCKITICLRRKGANEFAESMQSPEAMWMYVVWWKVDLVKWSIFPIGCLDQVFLQLIYIHSISLPFHIQNGNQALLTCFRKSFVSPTTPWCFSSFSRFRPSFCRCVFPVVPRHAPKTQPKSEIGAGSGIGSARIAASMPSSEARHRAPNHESGSTPGTRGTLKRRDHTVAVTCGISGNTLDTAKRNLVEVIVGFYLNVFCQICRNLQNRNVLQFWIFRAFQSFL